MSERGDSVFTMQLGTVSARLTGCAPMPETELQKILDEVAAATEGLTTLYSEAGAVRLLKALGNCDVFVAPSLDFRHTPEQERARRDYHLVCEALSAAIRHAIADPTWRPYQDQVVTLARAIMDSARALRSAFWLECQGR